MDGKKQPLCSNSYFDAYLEYHHISLLLAAQLAGIRLTEVWRIQHDLPVRFRVAASLRITLFKRTGVPYLAPISTITENQSHQLKKEQLNGVLASFYKREQILYQLLEEARQVP